MFDFVDETPNCRECGLNKGCTTPMMPVYGRGEKGIFVLGEASGSTEDEKGVPFVGESGKLLRSTLKKFGVNLKSDCFVMNSVSCRPKNNRTPTSKEISCCRPYIRKYIKKHKPKMIIGFGKSAIESLIGDKWVHDSDFQMKRWSGYTIPYDFGAYVGFTYHPSFILRNSGDGIEKVWNSEISKFLKLNKKGESPKVVNHKQLNVEILENVDDINKYLSNLLYGLGSDSVVSVDFETTSLKPEREGNGIFCVSFCSTFGSSFVFRLCDTDDDSIATIKKLFSSDRIFLTGHNISFERRWAINNGLGKISNFVHDSLLSEHILRGGKVKNKSLNFLTFVNFGVSDYSSDVKEMLISDIGGLNHLKKFIGSKFLCHRQKKVMRYCGLDTIFQREIAIRQMKELKKYVE